MASCNYSGINNVYGHYAQAKMNRCKFHYNLEQILHATTPTAYAHTFGEMKVYIMSNDSKDQMTWLDWQDKGKYFLVKIFVSISGPSGNLAEVVHAGWKNSHAIN